MSQIEGASDPAQSATPVPNDTSGGPLQSKSGWDGKLRVDKEKKAVLANPEVFSDPDYSDEDAPPVDQIEADEGKREITSQVSPVLTNLLQTCSTTRTRKLKCVPCHNHRMHSD